jgi:ketosteroid isomerase-like protein
VPALSTVSGQDDVGLEENKKTAVKLIEAMGTGTVRSCRNLVTDDLVARIPASSSVLGNAAYIRGADEVLEVKAAIRGDVYAKKMDIKMNALLADGDFVAAFIEMETMSFKGAPFVNQYVFLFRFRDGKISEWDAFMDTAYVYQQFGYKITKE